MRARDLIKNYLRLSSNVCNGPIIVASIMLSSVIGANLQYKLQKLISIALISSWSHRVIKLMYLCCDNTWVGMRMRVGNVFRLYTDSTPLYLHTCIKVALMKFLCELLFKYLFRWLQYFHKTQLDKGVLLHLHSL